MRFKCRYCGGKNYWKLGNGEYRCKVCKKDTGKYLTSLVRLRKAEWIRLIDLFLIGANSPIISKQLERNTKTVTKALRLLRTVMTKDVPDVFEGVVEVDETYLGGQKKNKNKSQLRREKVVFGRESKKGKGTTKQPVFGILCRNGKVFTELVDDTEAKDLIPIIVKKVKAGTRINSDTWRAYTGLATKGYVHRTVEHKEKEYIRGKSHINGLEGFWGFLKRKLASKGGVRRQYLPLFLGEYVWRYNHRKEELIDQRKRLIGLITSQFSARF